MSGDRDDLFQKAPACGDPFCDLDICQGPKSHGIKKPWFMNVNPVHNPVNDPPPSIVLMKVEGWVLEKFLESDTESQLWQYCPSMQWKKQMTIAEIRDGYCTSCSEDIPEEIVAAYTMHNWAMLQKYDADMKKYGPDTYDPVQVETGIQVYK